MLKELASWRRLELPDVQLIRYWRNLPHVRMQMLLQRTINWQQQLKWYERLDSTQLYRVVTYGDIDVGISNLTNIDLTSRTAEVGGFCGDSAFPMAMVFVLGLEWQSWLKPRGPSCLSTYLGC